MTKKRAEELIHAFAGGKWSVPLMAVLRPCIAVRTRPVDRKKLAVGASRIGGTPDVPVGFTWPRTKNGPLGCLVQIKLEDVASFAPAAPLPKTGLLYFFYDAENVPDGQFQGGPDDAKVVYVPAGTVLERQVVPKDLPESVKHFKTCAVTFRAQWSLPAPDTANFPPKVKLTDDERTEYVEMLSALAEGDVNRGRLHQMFGYPKIVGFTPSLEPNETLLMTIDCDGDAGWGWRDEGIVTFAIPEAALAKHDFSRANYTCQF